MSKIILSFIFVFFLFSYKTYADVVSPNGEYVKITQQKVKDKTFVSFQHCFDYPKWLKTKEENCPYGSIEKKSFSLEKLKTQKNWERFDLVGTILADAGVLFVTVVTGGMFLEVGGEALMVIAGSASGSTGGLLVGLGAGLTLEYFIDRLNPLVQYEDVNALNDKILNDETIFMTSHEDFFDFKENLENVLADIK